MLRQTLALLTTAVLAGCSGAAEPLSTSSAGSTGASQGGGSSPQVPGVTLGVQGAGSCVPSDFQGTCEVGTYRSCAWAGGTSIQSCDDTPDGPAWSGCGQPAPCAAPQSCTTASGRAGATCDGCACIAIGSCDPFTSPPPTGECTSGCRVEIDAWNEVTPCGTPLVLAFDGERVEFTRAAGAFDVMGLAMSVDTDWVSAATPWLAMDLDGDGAVDDGRELFGSMTQLPDGSRARNGFQALAALDADGDGRITRRDPAFSRLLVWTDEDQDRRSSSGELRRAGDVGLVAIDLAHRDVPMCRGGSCEVERARFVYRDGSGRERECDVIDVHLARR